MGDAGVDPARFLAQVNFVGTHLPVVDNREIQKTVGETIKLNVGLLPPLQPELIMLGLESSPQIQFFVVVAAPEPHRRLNLVEVAVVECYVQLPLNGPATVMHFGKIPALARVIEVIINGRGQARLTVNVSPDVVDVAHHQLIIPLMHPVVV